MSILSHIIETKLICLLDSEYTRTMYEYKFYRIGLDGFFPEKKPTEDYREVIREHAKNGWKLVQLFSPTVGVIIGGTSTYFELIFEKEKL